VRHSSSYCGPDLVTGLWTSQAPLYIAHRGGANTRWPEYSAPGMLAAADAGFAIELDIEQLADGTFVPLHDPTVDRTTTGRGPVADLTAAQWRRLRLRPIHPGADYAATQTLDDALTIISGRTLAVPDFKGAVVERASVFLDLFDRLGLRRASLISSSHRHIGLLAAERGFESMWQWDAGGRTTDEAELRRIRAAGVRYLTSDWSATTAGFVATAHDLGFKVIAYTPNTLAEQEVTFGKGFDGLFTDRPWTLSGRYAGSVTDPYASRVPAPNDVFAGPGADHQRFGRAGEYTLGTGDSATVSRRQGWALPGTPHVRLTFTVRFGSAATDQDGAFAAFLGAQPDDVAYRPGAHPGQRGLSVVGRRSGVMEVHGVGDDVDPVPLAVTTAPAAVAAAGAEGTNVFEVTLTATGLAFRNVTQGHALAVETTDPAYRAAAPPTLAFASSGAEVSFSLVSVEERSA
jgi:glycerophosphoryl diester phosphodiesterase